LLLRWLSIALGGWGLVILLCFPAVARASHDSHGGNCVAYARSVTGIELDGNAAAWWPHAAGRYERGQEPRLGSILVFRPYAGMRVGHVAVVSKVVGPREILLDQANWVRGRVSKAMLAVDASPNNDWTRVKVSNSRDGVRGSRENPTFGFIYPHSLPADFGVANNDEAETHHVHLARSHDATQHDRANVADTPHDHAKVADAKHRKDAKHPNVKLADATPKPIHIHGKHAKHHGGEDAKFAYLY
jgi:surface antigen